MKTWECSSAYRNFFSKIPKLEGVSYPKSKVIFSTSSSWTPHFVEPSSPRGPELIVILCVLPSFTCRLLWNLFTRFIGLGPSNSCSASLFLSSCFHQQSLDNVHITACLSCFKWLWNCPEHIRQAKHESTTTGQAKLVGIEPTLSKTFNLCTVPATQMIPNHEWSPM